MPGKSGSGKTRSRPLESTVDGTDWSAYTRLVDLPFWRNPLTLVPILLALLTSINTLGNGFAADDLQQVLKNPMIREFANIPLAFTTSVWSYATGDIIFSVDSYYRPLFSVLFTINYNLFGGSAWGWHLVNVILHAAATLLVFVVLNEFTSDRWVASIAAALFAVHPSHVESVAWISGVTDPLLSLFLLPALFFYLRFRKTGGLLPLTASGLFYFLSLLCKETAVAFPLVVGYLEVFEKGDGSTFSSRFRRLLIGAAVLGVATAAYLALRYLALSGIVFGGGPRYPLEWGLATIPLALLKYLKLLAIPIGYSYQHPTDLVRSVLTPEFIVPTLLLGAIAVAVFAGKSRIMRFSLVWFIAMLAPALAAIRQFDPEYVVQERYLYLPSMGFCLAAAHGIAWLSRASWLEPRGRTVSAAMTIAMVALFGAVSVRQNPVWADTTTVFKNCVALDPASPYARASLARSYFESGNPHEAEQQGRIALDLDPAYSGAYLNLSYFAHFSGRTDRAIGLLERGIGEIEENPMTRHGLATMHLNLGLLYAQTGEPERAEAMLLRSVEIWPRATGWYHLGQFYYDAGDDEVALRYFELTLQSVPRRFSTIHLKLARVYDRLGMTTEARESYERYLQLAPPAADERIRVRRRLSEM